MKVSTQFVSLLVASLVLALAVSPSVAWGSNPPTLLRDLAPCEAQEDELEKKKLKQVERRRKRGNDDAKLDQEDRAEIRKLCDDAAKKIVNDLAKPSISIKLDFAGNETDQEDLFNFGVGAQVRVGRYPRELNFQAGTKFQQKNGTLQEDVTNMLFNYDWYPYRQVQVYVFAQRFSSSFLSIDQRWEIGGGGEYEFHTKDSRHATRPTHADVHEALMVGKRLLDPSIRSCLDDRSIRMTRKGYEAKATLGVELRRKLEEIRTKQGLPSGVKFESWVSGARAGVSDRKRIATYQNLREATIRYCRAVRAVEQNHSRFHFGLSLGTFGEFEEATLSAKGTLVPADEDGVPVPEQTRTFEVVQDPLLRISARAGFLLRLSDDVSLRARHYLKLAEGRGSDQREDSEVIFLFKIPSSRTMLESVDIQLGFARHRDSAPQRLPGVTVGEDGTATVDLGTEGSLILDAGSRLAAADSHNVYTFKVGVSW